MNASIISPGERPAVIPSGMLQLSGTLAWPARPCGFVLFAHGSGSGRFSPRNAAVARQLRTEGVGTLLFDLLSEQEALRRANVFDIDLLAWRLRTAAEWLTAQSEASGLPLGYFGASTGAAAALVAAADDHLPVEAVVSRGGRPDLAGDALPRVRAATLLLVGGRDDVVLDLNLHALARLTCPRRLVVIPGATHLFEEPGTLEEVGRLAADWFVHYMARVPGPAGHRSCRMVA